MIAKDQVLINARNGKETRERIHLPRRRTPFRIISTPVYKNGRLTQIIQLGTHLRFVRKNLAHFRNNILIALPILLVLGALGGGFWPEGPFLRSAISPRRPEALPPKI